MNEEPAKWAKQQISKKKLQITLPFHTILDLKRKLNKNTANVEQIANNLEEIKIQQNDLKKDLFPFKSNTHAVIKALEASQQAIGKTQDFINEEFTGISLCGN